MAPGKRAMQQKAMKCAKKQRREEAAPAAKRAGRPKKDLSPESRQLVKTALRQTPAEVLPSSMARDMLVGSVDFCLIGECEDRDKYQKTAAAMIGEVLVGMRGQLQQTVEEKKAAVDEASEKKTDLQQGLMQLEQNLEQTKTEIVSKKELKAVDEKALKETISALEKTKAQAAKLVAKRDEAEGDKTKLTGIYEGCFMKLRDETATKGKGEKLLKSLTSMLGTMKADVSMLNGLPAAIMKPPDQRGDFDTMAIGAVDRLFAKVFQEKEQVLAGHAEEVRRGEETQQEAQQAVDAATGKLEQTVEQLKAAEEERKETEKSLKAQTAALKKHTEHAVDEADEALKTAEKNSQNFTKVEESFNYLQTFTTKEAAAPAAPVQEGEEEAPVVEEEVLEEEEEEEEEEELEEGLAEMEVALPVAAN